MCSNALIGARERAGRRGEAGKRASGQCGPVPRPSNPGPDHDAGARVRHLPRSEGPKQAFRAPKEKHEGNGQTLGAFGIILLFVSNPF